MADSKQPARKGTSRRTTVLAALLAVVAVVAVWLSDCIPGFGLGSSGDAGERTDADAAKPEAAKPETEAAKPEAEAAKPQPATPEPEAAKPQPPPLGTAGKTLNVKIDVAGCAVAGAEPVDCSTVCERSELFEGMDDAVLDIAGASHGSVIEMTDCLKAKGIDKIAIRRESP